MNDKSNKFVLFFAIAVLGLVISSCSVERIDESSVIDQNLEARIIEVAGSLQAFQVPKETDLDKIPQDPKNPLNPYKVKLGKMLFYETALGMDALKEKGKQTYSCATCHLPELGFRPGTPQGIADGGIGYGEQRHLDPDYKPSEADVQGARPLALIGAAYTTNTLWNGRFGAGGVNEGTEHLWAKKGVEHVNKLGYQGLEAQNIEGLHLHRMVINKEHLQNISVLGNYVELFDKAFPEFPESVRYTPQTASLAISAFLRTIMPYYAPFQRWLRGEKDAMTLSQKKGAMLFFSKARCYLCHKSPVFNSMEFHAIGVKDMWENPLSVATGPNDLDRNLGRGWFTERDEDMYKFKVPQLYNLKYGHYFFHGASKKTIREVLEYKNRAVSENPNVPPERLSPLFIPLHLSEEELDYLQDFIENALYDPYMMRFRPMTVYSGACFPNGDSLSREELGCN